MKIEIASEKPKYATWIEEISDYMQTYNGFEPLNIMVSNDEGKEFYMFVFEGNSCEMAILNKAFKSVRDNPDNYYTQEQMKEMTQYLKDQLKQ
jgi:hypothetical protein